MKSIIVLFCFMMVSFVSRGQVVSWELSAEPGDQVISNATFQGANFNNCVLSRGAGVNATTGAGSMNSSAWFAGSSATTLDDAIAGNDYYEFTINSINCLFFNPTTINIVLRSSATGPNTATLRCSSDGFTANIGTVTVTTTSTAFTFSEVISPNSSLVTYRLYGYGAAAGGGTPSAGGTMRVGTSVVASNNDIEVFATSTFLTVSQVANITVTDGDAVPATVFTANVPGAMFEWTRSPEDIAQPDLATMGTGNVPAFTADNNTGSPLTSTFSVEAITQGCTSVVSTFSITVEPPQCQFLEVNFAGSTGPCNDNGTPGDPSDDFFTKDVRVTFINPPGDGLLQIVPGGDQIGVYQIHRDDIIGLLHIFQNVKFKADGTQTEVQVNWTEEPNCIADVTGTLVVDPCSNSGSCEIIGFSFANISQCNDNGTPSNDADDFFTVDVDVLYSNSLGGVNSLRLNGPDVIVQMSTPAQIGTNLTHTFTGAMLRADGQITDIQADIFNAVIICSLPGTGPAVNSCSNGGGACAFTNIGSSNQGPCDDNGTVDPTDDFFTLNVTVEFENPPATGFLKIQPGPDFVPGGGDPDVPVGDIAGNTHTFMGIRYKADGGTTVIGAEFTADQNCIIGTNTGIIVEPCSFEPPVITCPPSVTVSCSSQVSPPDPASVSETHDCPGDVTVVHLSDITSSETCANRFTITRTYLVSDQCDNAVSCTQVISVFDNSPPAMTCPVSVAVQCASQVPPVSIGSVSSTDNCGGMAIITHVSDVTINQTCANRYTINRTYRSTDLCNNSSTCVQVITVFDNSAPTLTCPAAVTVQCASQVPPVSIGSVSSSDNCGGTAMVTHVSDVTVNQTCANRYTINRTYRSTDLCNNSATCVQAITVFDSTMPTLTCPAAVTVQCAVEVPPVNTASVATQDNCDGAVTVTLAADVTVNKTCLNRYVLHRIYRATDVCGNSATCTQVITVFDNISPDITFTDPLILGLPNGSRFDVQCYGQDPGWDLPDLNETSVSATDNCTGTITVMFNQTLQDEGDCPVDGYINLYRLTWTAIDACGNSSSRFLHMALVDTISPVIHGVPEDTTVHCDEIPLPPSNVYATDECIDASIISYHESDPAPGCQHGQVITRYWTAIDDCGNITIEAQNITLVDLEGPELQMQVSELAGAPDGSIFNYTCNEGGIPAFYNELSAESVYSPPSCGTAAAVSFSRKIIETSNCKFFGYIEQRTFLWKALDACGNETTLTIIARLIDTEPPVIVGVPDMTCVDDPALQDIEAIDNCEHAFLVFWDVIIPNPCGQGTAFRRTYEAYDECYNMTRDTVILIPNTHTPPVIKFINPLLAELEPGEEITIDCASQNGQQTPFSVQDVSVEGICSGDIRVSFMETVLETSDCSTNGVLAEIELKWTAIDICGNQNSISVIAHVVDLTSPVLVNFNPEVTIGCQEDLPVIEATDNCGDVSITIEERIIPGPCENEYDVERQIVATDPCGNTTSHVQIIHVGDGSGPVILGVVEEVCNDLSIPEVAGFDPCAGVYVNVTMTEMEIQTPCRDGRVIERNWSATDACGHTTTVTQRVIVDDHTPPEILIPTYSVIRKFLDSPDRNKVNLSQRDIIQQLHELNDASVFVQDDCDEQIIPEFTLDISYSDDCEAEGYFERRVYTWTASDVCGNSSSISFSVDIVDDIPPVFEEVPQNVTIICDPLPYVPEVYAVDPAQPVTVSYSESILPGNGNIDFLVSRMWTATDACGNVSVATQEIIWIPNTFLECQIEAPGSIDCNSHGVILSALVSGGLGGYTYEWEVDGRAFIQSGQGTDEVTLYVGWSDVEVHLTVRDAYGCSTTCTTVLECIDPGLDPFAQELQATETKILLNPDKKAVTALPSSPQDSYLQEFSLWPNPANREINLRFQSSAHQEIDYMVIDMLGQIVLRDKMDVLQGYHTLQIDISTIPDGTYLLQLKSDVEHYSKTLVILQNE